MPRDAAASFAQWGAKYVTQPARHLPPSQPQPQPPPPAEEAIRFYDRNDPYFEFTTFSRSHPIAINNQVYSCCEGLFQSLKFTQRYLQRQFLDLYGRDAQAQAYRLRQHQRWDWHEVNRGYMRAIIALKIGQHHRIKQRLLSTGDMELIFDSPEDSFFGVGRDGKGRNELGKIWMEHRTRLRAEQDKDVAGELSNLSHRIVI